MALFEVKNIKKSFGDHHVLQDISISVEQGEVVAILGPSGSGKSTLLRCSTLLETMDDGTLSFDGKNACVSENGKSVYASKGEIREIKQSYGLVFQDFNLFPHYTVLKNVCDAPIHVLKRDKSEVEKEAKELLAKVGLDQKLDAYPAQLSGGQQQRVAIARALANDPRILLCDEATSALDNATSAEIEHTISSLTDATCIVITHKINPEVLRNYDQILVFNNGQIVERGHVDELMASKGSFYNLYMSLDNMNAH